jgi:hypothetical protein
VRTRRYRANGPGVPTSSGGVSKWNTGQASTADRRVATRGLALVALVPVVRVEWGRTRRTDQRQVSPPFSPASRHVEYRTVTDSSIEGGDLEDWSEPRCPSQGVEQGLTKEQLLVAPPSLSTGASGRTLLLMTAESDTSEGGRERRASKPQAPIIGFERNFADRARQTVTGTSCPRFG